MTQIAIQPLVLKDMLMQIGADNFEKALSSVVFTPSASAITFQGGTPDASFTDTTRATWAAGLNYAQDWDTPGSLSAYLYNNEGATVPATFRPRNGRGPSFTSQLVITPGAIGGSVNAVSEASVTLGCQGKPVLIPAAAIVPVVSALAPANGGTAGGTLVKITGSGFAGATAVKFAATAAASFIVESDSVIYAVSPGATAGVKAVGVTTPTGTSAITASFTVA